MSRVEPKTPRDQEERRTRERNQRQQNDRNPSKAEGDERTVEEALRNQEDE
jgi:hypothetical protein